jgi:hypothetical protein
MLALCVIKLRIFNSKLLLCEIQMPTLVVTRARDFEGILRSYVVILDGVRVGRVWRGQTLELKIPQGRHVIAAKIDWCRSDPIVIDCDADEACYVEVGCKFAYTPALLVNRERIVRYIFAVMRRESYLYIRQTNRSDGV